MSEYLKRWVHVHDDNDTSKLFITIPIYLQLELIIDGSSIVFGIPEPCRLLRELTSRRGHSGTRTWAQGRRACKLKILLTVMDRFIHLLYILPEPDHLSFYLQHSEAGDPLEVEHAGVAAGRAQERRHRVDRAGERGERPCRRPDAANKE